MATKTDWKNAAAFAERSGYQLFVKDYCYRKKNGLSLPGTPSAFHQTHGLFMSNPGGLTNVRLQRDDVFLTGQVTVSFNYKKVESAPTPAVPFKFVATLFYFADGQNKTETHTWNAPAGNVAWNSISEAFGTADRVYYHVRIIFYLDSYDADVYFANFLIQDKTRTWTVDYDGTVLPEVATPAWEKSGGISTERIYGKRLFLAEDADSLNSVSYTRIPTFINAIGSSLKWRFKIKYGTPKDISVPSTTWSSKLTDWSDVLDFWGDLGTVPWSSSSDDWSDVLAQWGGSYLHTVQVVHSDGTYRVEYFFYQNGFILKLGTNYFKYHLDMTRYRTLRSFIQNNRLYLYHGRTLLFRKELSDPGGQEVTFAHFGRSIYDTESRWSYVKYYHGGDEDPGHDILKESWWLKAGEIWEPDTLYRKTGWTFLPKYHVPYFDVIYLT